MNDFFKIKNEIGSNEVEVFIYNRIGVGNWWESDGVSAEYFNKQIGRIEKDKQIKLRINSPGGSIYEGLSIYNYLKERKKKITCVIDGMCGSIATIIACAADKIIMNLGSGYFIHKPQTCVKGDADDLRDEIESLDRIEEQLVDIYSEKTGLSRDEIKTLLSNNTMLSDKEAVEKKFADELGTTKASACSDFSRFANELGHSETLDLWFKQKENKNMNENENENKTSVENLVPGVEEKFTLSPNEYKDYLENKMVVENFRKKEKEEKLSKITNMVTSLVNAGVYSNDMQVSLIQDSLESEKMFKVLQNSYDLYKKKEDAMNAPGNVEALTPGKCTGLAEIEKYHNEFVLHEEHRKYNELLSANRDYIKEQLKTNEITVSSGLKRDFIFKTSALEAFVKIMFPLNDIFTCIFKDTPLEGTNKGKIPYYPDDVQEVKDFHQRGTNGGVNEGYTWDGNYQAGEVELILDCHKYVDLRMTDSALNQTPFINMAKILEKKATNLAYKCWLYFLNKILAASYTNVYPENGNGIALSKWNLDAIVNLKTAVDKLQWPQSGRSLVLNSDYGNELLKGRVLQNSDTVGGVLLTKGTIKELTGFELHTSPNLPLNGEKLVGFAACAESLYILNQPVRPDEVIPMRYQVFIDDKTGLSMEYCKSGDARMREVNISLDTHFGAKVGNAAALCRIQKPA